jgi:hypothetical protein
MKIHHYLFTLLLTFTFSSALAQFVEKETRHLGEMCELRVNEGIVCEWILSEERKIEVEVDGVALDRVVTDQAGGILRIRMRTGIYPGIRVEVKVYSPEFSHIQANSGARITASTTISQDRFSVQTSTGGSILLNLDVDRLFVTAQTAGILTLGGKANLLIAEVTGGSRLEAFELMTQDTELRSNAGAQADITATKSVNIRANTGASVRYRGRPEQTNVSTQLGATITALD